MTRARTLAVLAAIDDDVVGTTLADQAHAAASRDGDDVVELVVLRDWLLDRHIDVHVALLRRQLQTRAGETVNLRACTECFYYVVHGADTSTVDHEALAHRWACWYLGAGWFDDEDCEGTDRDTDDLGFSSRPCDCCGSRLAGEHFKLHARLLTEGDRVRGGGAR